MAAVYGIKDNKSLEEQMRVIEVTLPTGSPTQSDTIDLPTGWTTKNCLIAGLFSFNSRGGVFSPVLKSFAENDSNIFDVTYDGSSSATTFFAVLIKK